ncbi:MAG TPA: hypothetical protein VI007_10715 [bacterium]
MVDDLGSVGTTEPVAALGSLRSDLAEVESRLIHLTRQASSGGQLDDALRELTVLAVRIRPHYAQLMEALERRDLTYQDVAGLEEGKRRVLWLYRRLRLEQIFFSKLRLERTLRDTLYRQILEGYDEFSAMEALEARLRGLPDDALAGELLREEVPGPEAGPDAPES